MSKNRKQTPPANVESGNKVQGNTSNKPSNNKNCRNSSGDRGKQGKKDSRSTRVNLDNERESKFVKQYEKKGMRAEANSHPNDISWYARNPELLKSAASFPFGEVLGSRVWKHTPAYVPGIMKIEFTFAYGGVFSGRDVSGIPTDLKYYPEAINQAAKSMYSFLVHANSRNYNYEYQDLQIVVSAGVQVFCAIAHVVRAYAIAKTYSEKSIYKPEAYLTAMGFDADEVRSNLGQMWFDINNLIAQTSQLWIPNFAPLLQRWIWLCSNIFTDAQSALGQSYLFVPRYFQQYNEVASTTGGCLEPASWNTKVGASPMQVLDTRKQNTWVAWRSTIQHMIDRLVNSEDRGIMFGDILNAYGADKIFAMPSVPSDVRIEPVFNPEVLTQIENLTVTHAACIGLQQTSDGLTPTMAYPVASANVLSQAVAPQEPVLNFHQPSQPSPEQIVIATRLTAAGTLITDNSYSVRSVYNVEADPSFQQDATPSRTFAMAVAFGSEVVSTIYFVVKDSTAQNNWNCIEYPWATSVYSDDWAPMSSNYVVSGDYLSFDWAPFIYWFQPDDGNSGVVGTTEGVIRCAFGDYDNYTTLDFLELSKLHQMALMSEFGLPLI